MFLSILVKVLHKLEMEGVLSNSFCEACINLILKPDKDIASGQQMIISQEERCCVRTCNPSFSGGRDQEDGGLRPD
jgi:hypothetical protein